jgi:ABC-type sulfate transport system substrate-binding protein
MNRNSWLRRATTAVALGALLGGSMAAHARNITLLNASYDPTRELYVDYNNAFAKHWTAKTGDDVRVNQAHGGSGGQARGVFGQVYAPQ